MREIVQKSTTKSDKFNTDSGGYSIYYIRNVLISFCTISFKLDMFFTNGIYNELPVLRSPIARRVYRFLLRFRRKP